MLFGDVIGPEDLAQLLALLCGRYIVDTAAGRIRVIADQLPGGAVAAILPALPDGVVRVVIDAEKPNAYAHTRAMLCEWWRSYQVPLVTEDGHVELVAPRVPDHDDLGPFPLYVEQASSA